MTDNALKHTPLYNAHVQNGGKMVDFAGWELPIHYGSQLDEHMAVREDAGMFDVSHMLVTDVKGKDVKKWLRKLVPNDVEKLKMKGKAIYTPMLNENAGVIDDIIIYRMDDDETWYRIVSNGATREKDTVHFIQTAAEFEDVSIEPRMDLAMIAIQGPRAIEKFTGVHPELEAVIDSLVPFQGFYINSGAFVSKTGYTGEEGIEVILPAPRAEALFDDLKLAGVKPCGLGARDTLRLEAGMNLYGHDMDDDTTPWEAGLAWTLALKDDRDFIGRKALEDKKDKVTHKQVGLVLEGKGIIRDGMKVVVDGVGEGVITSGTFSPSLKQSIAIARVPKDAKDKAQVEIRGKLVDARIIKMPFVRNGKKQFD